MRNLTSTIAIIFFVLCTLTTFAQSGQFDVRFNQKDIQCANNTVLVDIDVRATSSQTTFNMSDQNFRFSYNRDAVQVGSITIAEQFLTGFVPPASFYDPHTLNGSIDTVASYNVVLGGGTGQLITNDWLTVGTISFTILDNAKCLELIWHDSAPENFPPTFIGEKVGNDLFAVAEGNYYNTAICFYQCSSQESLPVEMVYFEGDENDCGVD